MRILTTVPRDWSVRKIHRELNVSRRAAWNAQKLRNSRGYASCPDKKKGRPLKTDVLEKIEEFYTSDKYSRVMPGRKDYIKIVTNDGARKQIQKRLLLLNINELYGKFCAEITEVKISLSAFTKLRPGWCIPVGPSGTHNVCVCRIHQNMNLKFVGLNDYLKKRSVQCDHKVRDILKSMVCEKSAEACFLLDCKNCPGVSPIIEKLSQIFDDHNIEKIQFKSWTSTDR